MTSMIPCGDFKTGYSADTTIFPTHDQPQHADLRDRGAVPALRSVMDKYALSLLIQIGYLGIAALGLNILVGFTGQISIGHAAFFGFGAFTSAWLVDELPCPGRSSRSRSPALLTTAVGLIFGLPGRPPEGPLPGDRHAGGAVHPAGLLRPRLLVHGRRRRHADRAVLDLRLRLRRPTSTTSTSCWPMSS